jgi:hypothetical protein
MIYTVFMPEPAQRDDEAPDQKKRPPGVQSERNS